MCNINTIFGFGSSWGQMYAEEVEKTDGEQADLNSFAGCMLLGRPISKIFF